MGGGCQALLFVSIFLNPVCLLLIQRFKADSWKGTKVDLVTYINPGTFGLLAADPWGGPSCLHLARSWDHFGLSPLRGISPGSLAANLPRGFQQW